MDMTLSHTMFYNHFKTRDLFMSGGEAYYKLTPQGENAAKKGYNKQKRRQERLTLLKEYKEYINIICTIITIASMCITIIISLMK